MTTIRAGEALPHGKYDARHYCRVHHHLFQDVYSWAGKYRRVRTAKGGNPFCFPEHIPRQMDVLFGSMATVLQAADAEAFVQAAARFLAELNAIHPFREGNGRSQLAFMAIVGDAAGYPFAFDRIKRATFLPAMIQSYDLQIEPLIAELRSLLK